MELVNSYMPHCPEIAGSIGHPRLLYALTQDDTGQYAVYKGIVQMQDATDIVRRETLAWQVAFSGQKCQYGEAKAQFPMLPEDLYRA